MNLKTINCTVLCLILSVGVFAQTAPAKRDQKSKLPPLTSHVILILIDGLRSEDFQNAKLKIPTLQSLRERGVLVLNVESVYPSQSLPAQATILSGMLPADHGITADAPFDEKKGQTSAEKYPTTTELKTDTFWQAAKQARIKTAANNFPFVAESSNLTADTFEKERPQIWLLKFDEIANSLQRFGAGSSEAAAALEQVDTSLKTILDSIERAKLTNETTFLIVSSHGFARVEQVFRPNLILARKGFLIVNPNGIITSWIATTRASGGAAAIYLQDQANEELAKTLETVFAEIHKTESSPIWRIVSKKDATKLGADPRAAFFLEAAPGFVFSEQTTGKKVTDKLDAAAGYATAGYLPSRTEMRGMLLAAGKGIKPKTQIEYARLVDIAPTIARLLGFELKATRGHVISGILAQ